jgi:hypothetical protein
VSAARAARSCALWATAWACLGACATKARPPAIPAGTRVTDPATSELERFLPLRDGDVLSYLVWLSSSEQPEQVIFQVERLSPNRASLRAGDSARFLALGPDGIRQLDGGYLLAPPLTLGAEWAGAAGRVRITATDQSLEVPAGHFEGCLITTEADTRARLPRSIVTTYCPDVGIARIQVDDAENEQRFELKSFGPAVDIGAL